MARKQVLDDIVSDECDKKYCILREIFAQTGIFDDRTALQLKCIEKFKYEESERQKKDIGWDEATKSWCKLGYAKKYAEVYDPEKSFKELYKQSIS